MTKFLIIISVILMITNCSSPKSNITLPDSRLIILDPVDIPESKLKDNPKSLTMEYYNKLLEANYRLKQSRINYESIKDGLQN